MYESHVDFPRWFSAKKFVRAMIRKWLVKKKLFPGAGRQGDPFLIRTWMENFQNNPEALKPENSTRSSLKSHHLCSVTKP